MSGSTDGLSRKISSAQDLQGVVRSMKALAASSIAQYEKAVLSLDQYYRTVELGLSACFRQADPEAVAGPTKRGQRNSIGAVIIGSDQGLVGGFNEVLTDFAQRTLKDFPGEVKQVWAVGERAHRLMVDLNIASVESLNVPTSVNTITSLVGRLLLDIQSASDQGEVAQVLIFHNHPKIGAQYVPECKQLLPLDAEWRTRLAAIPWPTKSLPQVIEAGPMALRGFIREYLFVVLFQACAESLASENASRLAAMQRADKNIEEILDDLKRTLHRVRQESIDEELFDVISGFEALSVRRRREQNGPTS